jgi:putative phosphoribosyl transferase
LERQARLFRAARARVPLGGRTALVVDDGAATGASARAACEVARAHGAANVVLVVPVASPEAMAGLAKVADAVRCLETPAWLGAIGQFYRDFSQTSDDQVVRLLGAPVGAPPRVR